MSVIGSLRKQPDEKFPVSANFLSDLTPDSDTISGVTTKVTKTSVTPNVDSSANLKDGAPTISGTKVIQKLKDGVDKEVHRLEFESRRR